VLADRAEEHDASLLMSVHAAIAANDAICVALLGFRSSEPDHERAVDLLESAAHLEEDVGTRVRAMASSEPWASSNGRSKSWRVHMSKVRR